MTYSMKIASEKYVDLIYNTALMGLIKAMSSKVISFKKSRMMSILAYIVLSKNR